jgi:hypothetical protein
MRNAIQTLLLLLLFTAIVRFTVGEYSALWHNLKAADYPSVPGKILRISKDLTTSPSNSKPFRMDVLYEYSVASKRYRGTRLRYHGDEQMSLADAKGFLARFPAGSTPPVFYDPDNPSNATLVYGIDENSLVGSVLFTCFLLALALPLRIPAMWLWHKFSKPEAAGVRFRKIRGQTHVYLPDADKLVYLTIMATTGVAAAAITGFTFASYTGDHKTSIQLGAAVFLLLVSLVLLWRWQRDWNGRDDLIIDRDKKLVSFPLTFGRKKRLALSFDEIDTVRFEMMDVHSKVGDICFYTIYICHLSKGQELLETKLAFWCEQEERADRFATWLADQIPN